MRADNKAIAKAVETFLIFALQLHSNSYLSLNISVDNGSKTAEANRENVRRHFRQKTKTPMTKAGRPYKSDPRVDSMTYDIEKGDNEKVKLLLSEVGIDACDSYLRTALIWATFYDNITCLLYTSRCV